MLSDGMQLLREQTHHGRHKWLSLSETQPSPPGAQTVTITQTTRSRPKNMLPFASSVCVLKQVAEATENYETDIYVW